MPEIGRKTRGNDDRQGGGAPIEGLARRRRVRQAGPGGEIGGCVQMADKIATEICVVMVDDHSGNPVDVETQGIAKQQDQQERYGERQIKTPEIPAQMIKLFASDSLDPSPIQFSIPEGEVDDRPSGVLTGGAV